MNAILSPAERNRLIAILGMLGSDFDGERASVALMASRLLKNAGLVWADVVVVPQARPRQERPRHDPSDPFPGRSWYDIAARCGEYPQYLDAWELEFIEGLRRFPRLSPKQFAKLSTIVARLRTRGCKI
jgi:hypothetical protein